MTSEMFLMKLTFFKMGLLLYQLFRTRIQKTFSVKNKKLKSPSQHMSAIDL